MDKTLLITFVLMAYIANFNKNWNNRNDENNVDFEQEHQVKFNDTAEIFIGKNKLVIFKNDDYNYQLVVYANGKRIANTDVYTGFSPSQIYYDNRFFVMDAGIKSPSFIVYDVKKNNFKKYKGHWDTTFTFRIIAEKLYIGCFDFPGQESSLLVIDLNTEERRRFYEIEGEAIKSSVIRVVEKDGNVYVLLGSPPEFAQSYIIKGKTIKKSDVDIYDYIENIKLSELFK